MNKVKFLFFVICLLGCIGWSAFLTFGIILSLVRNTTLTLDFNYYHEGLIEAVLLVIWVIGGFIGVLTIKGNPWRAK